MTATEIGNKKPTGQRNDKGFRVRRELRIREDVWNMLWGLKKSQTVGEYLEPIIKNAYREYITQQLRWVRSLKS